MTDHEHTGGEGGQTTPNAPLVEEVLSALVAHDRRSEEPSPDPATAEGTPRTKDLGRVAREEARRLRGAGRDRGGAR